MVRRIGAVALTVCALVVGTSVSAQSIDGVLLERDTNQPVPLGLVTLLTEAGDSVDAVLSDEAGRFRVSATTAGDYLLSATALGYVPTLAGSVFSLGEGGSMSIEFRIEHRPIEIGGITVETRASLISQPRLVRNGFVERAQRGFGRFITPRDIDESPSLSTTDLLSRTGRVTTRYSVGGDRIVMLGPRGYCTPAVYLDGFRVGTADMPLDALVPLQSLEAAEVYRSGAQAPLRYGGTSGGCGVIVLWTRGG